MAGDKETATQRKRRLENAKIKRQYKIAKESDVEKRLKLQQRRSRSAQKIKSQTSEQRASSLLSKRQCLLESRSRETFEQRSARLEDARQRQARLLATETAAQRSARIEDARQRQAQLLATETAEQRSARIEDARQRQAQLLATETAEQRSARLERAHQTRVESAASINTFNKTPCNDFETMNNVETWISSEENGKKLVTYLSFVGGNKVPVVIRRILEKLFTNNFAVLCNWTGKNNKIPLKDLKLIKIIRDSPRTAMEAGKPADSSSRHPSVSKRSKKRTKVEQD